LKVIPAAIVVLSLATPSALHSQQGSAKPRRKPSSSSEVSFQTQVLERLSRMQAQINALQDQVADKDAQIKALQRANESSSNVQAQTASRVTALASVTTSDNQSVTDLKATVDTEKQDTTDLKRTVQTVAVDQREIRKSVEEPVALHYKGVTLTPGGFIAGESIWRQRAMNADIYTNFNGTPYSGAGEAHTSEWVPSARQTRLSALASGKVPFGTLSGFFEGDFLVAGTTSNNLQSNSYGIRIRQAWGQAAFGRFKFTGGQMWTLLTENKKATDAGQESTPLIFDGNLHVGYTYLRQPGFRLQAAITSKTTLAVALENSQYQFSASNASPNFFFGNAGPAGTSAANAQNDTRVGGGFVASARFPISKLDIGLHLVAGDGTGRYGASLLPDITVRPNGTLAPLRNAQGLFSLEYHAGKKLDIFGYAGTEYVQRTYYISPTGVLVGYAPPSANNSGCNTEAVPTGATGYLPGTATCLGATRALVQGSAGWVYRVYTGPAGRLQYGVAYSYLSRAGWAGVGGAPTATNNFVYTSFRYYLP
jgi:hypothetical protein